MAKKALAAYGVFAVTDHVLALAEAAVQDLDDHELDLPSQAKQQLRNHYQTDFTIEGN